MPTFVLVLIRVFIGVPGGLIWGAGLFCGAAWSCMFFGTDFRQIHLVELAALAAAALVTMIGFTMVMSVEIVTSGKRYRMEARRLIPCAGLEFIAQLLAIGSISMVIAAIMRGANGKMPLAVVLGIAGILMVAGTTFVASHANTMRKRWKAEYRILNESPRD